MRNDKPIRACLFASFVFAAAAASAAESPDSLRFGGEARADAVYSIGGSSDSFASASTLRLDAVGGYRDSAKFEASAIGTLAHVDGETLPAAEVKKLYVSVFTEYADVSAGRMIVNYGRGTVFSPVDLFSSVDLSDLSLGRIGTDALRVIVPLGDFSGLDFVSTLAEKPADAIAGGRFFGNLSGWDFAVSAFRDGGAFFGVDLKGDAFLGVSAEAVARIEERGVRYRLMGGLDYSVGGEWFFDAEYLENRDAGSPERIDAFGEGRSVFVSVSWKPDKLSALDARAVATFATDDPVWVSTFSASRSIARGAMLTGYVSYASVDRKTAIGTRLAVSF